MRSIAARMALRAGWLLTRLLAVNQELGIDPDLTVQAE
jgi:hypothetical protein